MLDVLGYLGVLGNFVSIYLLINDRYFSKDACPFWGVFLAAEESTCPELVVAAETTGNFTLLGINKNSIKIWNTIYLIKKITTWNRNTFHTWTLKIFEQKIFLAQILPVALRFRHPRI